MTTDSAIIRASLRAPAAFGELFERHKDPIYRYTARRVGVDTADDVLSETFLIAFSKRSQFDHGREDARPWLFGIATNLIGRHFAAETRALRLIAVSPAEHVAVDDFELLTDRLDAITHVGALGAALASLSRTDRETLLLYAWAELTYDDIATATGVSIGTVKSRLNRVRRRLRLALVPSKTSRATTHDELPLLVKGTESWMS